MKLFGVDDAACATLDVEVVMRTTIREWEDQWESPSSRAEQVAPFVALALAVLVALI